MSANLLVAAAGGSLGVVGLILLLVIGIIVIGFIIYMIPVRHWIAAMFSGVPSFVFQVKLEHGVIKEETHSFIEGERFCISLTSLTSDVPRFYLVNANGDSTTFFTELGQAVQ